MDRSKIMVSESSNYYLAKTHSICIRPGIARIHTIILLNLGTL